MFTRLAILFVVLGLALSGVAGDAAAQAPPPPIAANGQPVTTVATGVPTPTSFAFDHASGTVFVGAYGDEESGKGGGVFAIGRDGVVAQVPKTPSAIAGLAMRGGKLFVSAVSPRGGKILAFSGWNGAAFASSRTIFNARRTVGSVNGLAFGPDGRLYGGAGLVEDVDKKGRVKPSPFPDPYTVFSITDSGRGFRVVARGMRQPWQLTFVGRSRSPYVSVLSQDEGRIPRDAIVVARRGADFGFPTCSFGLGQHCSTFTKPLVTLPKHASPMGIGAAGDTLYVALFGGLEGQPEVVSLPARGGTPTPFLTGFAAPVVATNVDEGNLYAGDLTGSIYRMAIGS
jgi:glucose/arabinose dehydrogenase